MSACRRRPREFPSGQRGGRIEVYGFIRVVRAGADGALKARSTPCAVATPVTRSLTAGITREVASAYRIDARRTFVAGMSAGASMAVILGAMYPELYVAVGAHSGLPYGAARDMPSAFSAMQGGAALPGQFQPPAATPSNRAEGSNWTPTIVFHGDKDRTVNARNADAIFEQVTVVGSDHQPLRANVQTGTAPGGRRYSGTDYLDHANRTLVEHWMVHGAGHAWSGGSPNDSFTDPTGPDASAEMIRFFLSQRRAGTS